MVTELAHIMATMEQYGLVILLVRVLPFFYHDGTAFLLCTVFSQC